jgi:predicted nucleic acid-binding protein
METPLVFDATPLIYLARVDRLELGLELADSCLVPEPVHEEVVAEGLDAGYADARRIQRAVEADRLEIREPPADGLIERLEQNDGLSEADISVLALTAATGGTAIMDEHRGRQVARVEEITVHGTAFLVLVALRDGALDRQETLDIIDEMIEAGWHCSTELYARIRERIDDLSEE